MNEIIIKQFAATEDNDVVMKKCHLKGKVILKLLLLIVELFFFMPFCTVSCSGYDVSLNGVKSSFGFEVYGEKVDGNPLCLLLLILPIVMIAVFFIKKIKQNKMIYLIISGCSLIDAIILLVYKSKITSMSEEQMLDVNFNSGYYLSLTGNILILLISAFMFYVIYTARSTGTFKTENSMQRCCNCGANLRDNAVYCNMCGTKNEAEPIVTDTPIVKNFCNKCGTKLQPGMDFCPECGNKNI